ncbi:MAG: SDR family NAD(P)-dependent oxidoreductase [Planctomycetota bacterium]
MQSLEQRRALVTGASAGIGAATARALAHAGAEVTLLARRRERLAEVAQECAGARIAVADVRDAAAVARAIGSDPFDIVVANAGLALGVDRLPGGSPDEWRTVIDTNVNGVLNVLHAALPAMVARGHGDVVVLGSVAGRQVYPGGAVYCASKHAVRALYEGLRLDLAGSGLRFATIDPGLVGGTEFSPTRMRGDLEKAKAVYAGIEPLQAEDIAEIIVFVVSRPARVNIGEVVVWASAQASTTVVTRKS